MAVGKEADMSNAMKLAGHGVLQEAADELVSGERHHFGFAVLTIVLPGEANLAIVEPNQTAVGDCDTMSVAPEITEYLLGSGERRLGEDDPSIWVNASIRAMKLAGTAKTSRDEITEEQSSQRGLLILKKTGLHHSDNVSQVQS